MTRQLKFFLPIAALSALLIAASFLITRPGCGNFPDALCQHGWPFVFYKEGGLLGLSDWDFKNLTLNVAFFAAIAGLGWRLARKKV